MLGKCADERMHVTPSTREASNSNAPVTALTPMASASQLRIQISESRLAHYFTLKSTIDVEMRLGGVSDGELKALTHREGKKVLNTAIEWLAECHGSHIACRDLGSESFLPTRLVDIRGRQLKVVDGASMGRAKYIALSYCWGGDQVLKLTGETAHALREGFDPSRLALTIQDAIKAARELGIDYLWVDSLCIIQDEGSGDWDKEAANIHHIYGNAYVTLSICSASNASDGFMDMQWPETLEIDPKQARLVDMLPDPCRKSVARIRTESPLAGRGWIFQEELLSPRILYWSHQGLFWSCSTAKYAENGTVDGIGDELFPHMVEPLVLDPHEFWKTKDPLLLWDDMITSFSVREFSIDEDRLPAVSALATLIQKATGEEYLLGLWQSRLPSQVLWIVISPPRVSDPGKDRMSTTSAGSSKPYSPSWSWSIIAPSRKIIMPKQASSRARFHGSSWKGLVMSLHLSGRLRSLTSGLDRLSEYPQEERAANTHLQFPILKNQGAAWSVSEQKRQILICLDWKRPIVIYLDNEVPPNFDALVCFEVNYIGLLLLEPVSAHSERVYRRIGCAQTHREPHFFDFAHVEDITLV